MRLPARAAGQPAPVRSHRSRGRRAAGRGAAVLLVVACLLGVTGTAAAASADRMGVLIDEGVDVVEGAPGWIRTLMGEGWLVPPGTFPSTEPPARPLPQAHAHNDYEHWWPLLDALDHGFTSVEVDVWLVDGELLVSHDREDVVAGRTLERLYLDPLAERVAANGGTVHPGWHGSFRLLVDVKSEARPTYAALHDVLREHARIMTSFTDRRTDRGAVTAVVSGNRDRAAMRATPTRYAGYDGALGDLDDRMPPSFMPLVSADWSEAFTWDGTGAMPAGEERRLRHLVATAHRHGHRIRFWGTPDEPGEARDAVWRKLLDVGVDEISTDDLDGLQEFLAG